MKLYYKDEDGKQEFITETRSDAGIFAAIESYCTEHDYGLIYMIHHIENNKIYYEFGREGCCFIVEI